MTMKGIFLSDRVQGNNAEKNQRYRIVNLSYYYLKKVLDLMTKICFNKRTLENDSSHFWVF